MKTGSDILQTIPYFLGRQRRAFEILLLRISKRKTLKREDGINQQSRDDLWALIPAATLLPTPRECDTAYIL